ncbi:MAG: 50S ribosomal protein L15 [Puniceicoccales bacterium]|jgi:large subunit ribosomal protein L15|nr:50S ribosomal protein L15 [Puniceicoccales bacterium]
MKVAMKLSELPKISAYAKNTKRRGKGVGSGQGKTAGRGHKGGKARAGYSPAPCCCGIPFYRHLPVRGFSNAKFQEQYSIVSLQALESLQLDTVDKSHMQERGLIRNGVSLVKVLGGGALLRPMTIIADKFSRSALTEIEHSGGRAIYSSKSSGDAND